MEASLTTDPDNEDLNKLKKDLQVSSSLLSLFPETGVCGLGLK